MYYVTPPARLRVTGRWLLGRRRPAARQEVNTGHRRTAYCTRTVDVRPWAVAAHMHTAPGSCMLRSRARRYAAWPRAIPYPWHVPVFRAPATLSRQAPASATAGSSAPSPARPHRARPKSAAPRPLCRDRGMRDSTTCQATRARRLSSLARCTRCTRAPYPAPGPATAPRPAACPLLPRFCASGPRR